MHIVQEGHCIYIDQTDYLQKVLQYFCMKNVKPVPTPLSTGYYTIKTSDPIDITLQNCFQKVIGFLLYLMLGTRSDITFAVI